MGVVIEGKFERTGLSDVPLRFFQPLFDLASLFAGQAGIFKLFQDVVDFLFGELRRGEQDQLLAGLVGDVEEGAVVRAALGVPGDDGKAFETSGMVTEYREIGAFEVVENFAFQCFEIQVHWVPIWQIQNSTG